MIVIQFNRIPPARYLATRPTLLSAGNQNYRYIELQFCQRKFGTVYISTGYLGKVETVVACEYIPVFQNGLTCRFIEIIPQTRPPAKSYDYQPTHANRVSRAVSILKKLS
jgi:hypothetical protein